MAYTRVDTSNSVTSAGIQSSQDGLIYRSFERADVYRGCLWSGYARKIELWSSRECTGVDGRAAAAWSVIATTVAPEVDEAWISLDGARDLAIDHSEVRAVVKDEVVEVAVVRAKTGPELLQGEAIVHQYVVGDEVIVSRAGGGPDKYARLGVPDEVVGDRHAVRRMPCLDTLRADVIDDVVLDFAADVGVVDAMDEVARTGLRDDSMNRVTDGLVAGSARLAVVDPSTAVGRVACGNGQVADLVVENPYVRGETQDSLVVRAGDGEPHDVDVTATVLPGCVAAGGVEHGALWRR